MPSEIKSRNFFFLRPYEPQLDRIGALAERYFRDDPNTCLIKLRQFGEQIAQQLAARTGLLTSPDEPQSDLLRRLKFDRAAPREVVELFHQLRIVGNQYCSAHLLPSHRLASISRVSRLKAIKSEFFTRVNQ
jgi:type I restriction enzyme R subunit